MKKFEVGKTYKNEPYGYVITVIKRTAKTITYIVDGDSSEPRRSNIRVGCSFTDGEYVFINNKNTYAYGYFLADNETAQAVYEEPETVTISETEPAAPQEAANDEPAKEETEMTVMEKIEAIVSKYGVGMSHKALASKVYRELTADGTEAVILNDRYIMAGGVEYQFVKRAGAWTVKALAQAAATDAETAEAAQAPEADADNKAAAMTAQETTARKMIKEEHKMTLQQLYMDTLHDFEEEAIDGVVVHTDGGEDWATFDDVLTAWNFYGDREIEPIYLGGDEPASMTKPDEEGLIHVALVHTEAAEEPAPANQTESDSAAGQPATQDAELTAFEREGMRNGCFPIDKDAGTAACKAYREALAARGIDTALTHFSGGLFEVKGVDGAGNLFDLPVNACG